MPAKRSCILRSPFIWRAWQLRCYLPVKWPIVQGEKPVAIPGAALFIIASVFCSHWLKPARYFLQGAFYRGWGAGCCYVVAFAILRDTLDDRRRAKVLSLLNGITCIIPVLAPVLGHLIMLKFPVAESVLDDGNDGHRGIDVVFVYLKRNAPCGPRSF